MTLILRSNLCNERPSQATETPSVEKHAHPPRVVYCAIYLTLTLIRCTNVFYKRDYPVTLLPPPRRLVPSLGLGTTWVRQLRSGSTAATKCNERPSQATETPSVEKHAHPPRVVYCAIYLTLTLIRCTNVFYKGDYPVTLEMPLPKEAPYKISTRSAKRFQRRSLKLWTTDGRTDDGRRIMAIL